MNIGILDLDPSEADFTIKNMAISRNLENHCKLTERIRKHSILAKFLSDLNDEDYDKQKQLNNPTIIDTVTDNGQGNVTPGKTGKTIVFTAYLMQNFVSCQHEGNVVKIEDEPCWYPTIFFHDLDQQKIVWEIFGAEQFIHIDKNNKVSVLTNEIWTVLDKEAYETEVVEAGEENFTRHDEYDNYFWKIRYQTNPDMDQLDLEYRQERAPQVQTASNFKLTFGLNKDLEITEKAKVVDTILHSDEENKSQLVTLLYEGLASYTFQLRKAKSLTVPTKWLFNGFKHELKIPLRFQPKKHYKNGNIQHFAQASGVAKDDNDTDVDVRLELDDYRNSIWFGYFDEGSCQNRLFIPSLEFKNDRTFSCDWLDEEDGCKYLIEGSIFSRKNPHKTNANQATRIQSNVFQNVEFTLTQTSV